MSQSITEQLKELALFKMLITQILKDTGNTAPDTGFKPWYEAVKFAILNNNNSGWIIPATVKVKKAPVTKVAVNCQTEFYDRITARVTVEKVTT